MKMIFMNTENSNTSVPYQVVLSLPQRLNLRGSNTHVAFQNLPIYYTWKKCKTTVKKQ